MLVLPASQASAAPVALTITPLTWNMIGLDSNTPATGPYRFPVGVRVCNVPGGDTATGVVVDFGWDSANAFINLRPGSLSSISLAPVVGGSCADAYFEAEVTRTTAAFDTTRRYHVTATHSPSGATATTPQPRELYVERLISQNRNGVDSIKLNGVSIPAGGTLTLVVGNTYTIELGAHTATQGYNQLEGFINFPNTIFQTLAVNTTYSADSSPHVSSPSDKLYADGCLWENDPGSPNYRSCVGGDGKAGGTVVTTYTVKILSGAGTSESLNSLLYDFSGSSYHYNADLGTGFRIAQIVSPASVTISKAFVPRAIAPGGTSRMTFNLTNPTTETFTGVNFADPLLGGLVVAANPAVTSSGCGAGAFAPVPIAGATSLAFAGATVSANSVCKVTVDVTAPAGAYPNTTGNLFVNGTTNTGNVGQDTLTVAAAPSCVAGRTLATWSVPTLTTANPPDTTGGLPTVKAANVSTATATANVPAKTEIIATSGQGDSTSWRTYGYKAAGQFVQFVVDTSAYSAVSMSFHVANPGGANGPNSLSLSYDAGAGFITLPTNFIPGVPFSLRTQDFTALTSAGGNTTFRLTATGANNENSSANLDYDNISFTGCGVPSPAPTIAKSFSPDPIVKGAASTLTFTISNLAGGNTALTGIAFSDVLPAGLSIADSSSTQCSAGTVTTTAATRTISLAAGTLATGATCTFDVAVTGTSAGRYDNVTGYISSTESGISTNYATDSLTVVAPPTIAEAFSPTSILTGGTSTLSFTLTNTNLVSTLSGIGFTDALPSGVTVGSTGPTSTCGGSLTTTAPGSLSFTGGSLAANTTCTFSVSVTGATPGTKINTTSVVSSTEGGPGTIATATLIVNNPVAVIDLNKQVSTDGVNWFKFVGVPAGGNVFYRFSAYNGGDTQFTAISVADPTLAGTAADPVSCSWTTPLLQGDTAQCVTGPILAVTGLRANTATATGTSLAGSVPSLASTATYGTPGLGIAKSATETSLGSAGDVLHYSYVVTNSGFVPLLGPVTVADDKSTDEACPAVSTVGDFDNYLDPGEAITCSATYTVLAGDVTAGFVTNIATATAASVTSAADAVTVTGTLSPSPSIALVKSASPVTVTAAGQPVTYSFVVTNTGNVTLDPVVVTDPLVGLSPVVCPSTTLAPGAVMTCTASYTVTLANMNVGSVVNTATATGTPPTGPAITATATVTVSVIRTPAITVVTTTSSTSFTDVGEQVTYTITATNSGNVTIIDVSITDPNAIMVDCPPTTLAPGQSVSCVAVRAVTRADIDSGSLINTARVVGNDGAVDVESESNTIVIPRLDQFIPPTGSNAKQPLVWATFLVTVGVMLFLAARRRRVEVSDRQAPTVRNA